MADKEVAAAAPPAEPPGEPPGDLLGYLAHLYTDLEDSPCKEPAAKAAVADFVRWANDYLKTNSPSYSSYTDDSIALALTGGQLLTVGLPPPERGSVDVGGVAVTRPPASRSPGRRQSDMADDGLSLDIMSRPNRKK